MPGTRNAVLRATQFVESDSLPRDNARMIRPAGKDTASRSKSSNLWLDRARYAQRQGVDFIYVKGNNRVLYEKSSPLSSWSNVCKSQQENGSHKKYVRP